MKAIQDEHTPGPWGVAPNGKQVLAPHVIQRDNVLVRKLSGATPEQVEANARLIAAAPELLDALRKVLEFDGSGDAYQWDAIQDTAWAVIAKAEKVTP